MYIIIVTVVVVVVAAADDDFTVDDDNHHHANGTYNSCKNNYTKEVKICKNSLNMLMNTIKTVIY
jgi:hypothetical protein